MAVKTPTSVLRESVGSTQYSKAIFSDIDNGDTYASGLTGVVGYWVNGTDDPGTTTFNRIEASESSGTFTFYTGEANRTGELYIQNTELNQGEIWLQRLQIVLSSRILAP